MKIEKYAAIDIGSNAIRTLIANIVTNENGSVFISKNALLRAPIRLGEDTFTSGNISNHNIKRMLRAMKAFKLLIKVHSVVDYNVYATSALREANNRLHVVELIKKKTGIEIEMINGKKEAKLISSLDLFQGINKQSNFLFVDAGGGSTEFSILQNGDRVIEKSFKIGTVRLLNNMVSDLLWDEVKKWIVDKTKDLDKLSILGTGGNINKIHRITQTKEGKPITSKTLRHIYKKMSLLTYNERIINYQLNPDRADVILPALQIYLRAMQWSNTSKIHVQKIGLTDGMIEELYMSRKNLILNI